MDELADTKNVITGNKPEVVQNKYETEPQTKKSTRGLITSPLELDLEPQLTNLS